MKKTQLLYCFLLLFTITSNAQWVQLPFEQENLESLYFKDANTGYVGTYSTDETLPKLFKTADGGMNWTEISLPDIGNYTKITTIHFFDDNTGFLTTDDQYTSLRTTDGGETWTDIFCGINDNYCTAYFKNDGTGFYYSYSLTYSSNQGVSWEPVNIDINGFLIYYIHFINNEGDIGYMIQDWGIVKTTDGGQTWSNLYSQEQGGSPRIFFLNENVGYRSTGFGIYKTTNGGESWDNTYVLGGSELYFVNEDFGFMISSNFQTTSTDSTIYKTINGGESWHAMYKAGSSDNVPYISDFDFPDNTTGYAISTDGHIYKLDVMAGVETVTENMITVYPIPAKDILNINNVSILLNNNYQIVDMTGKIITKGIITSNEIAIDKLSNGMYLLKIGDNKAIKFVKN